MATTTFMRIQSTGLRSSVFGLRSSVVRSTVFSLRTTDYRRTALSQLVWPCQRQFDSRASCFADDEGFAMRREDLERRPGPVVSRRMIFGKCDTEVRTCRCSDLEPSGSVRRGLNGRGRPRLPQVFIRREHDDPGVRNRCATNIDDSAHDACGRLREDHFRACGRMLAVVDWNVRDIPAVEEHAARPPSAAARSKRVHSFSALWDPAPCGARTCDPQRRAPLGPSCSVVRRLQASRGYTRSDGRCRCREARAAACLAPGYRASSRGRRHRRSNGRRL